MNNGYPPNALETKECPPHLWYITVVDISESSKPDYHEIGICSKCHTAVKDFGKEQRRQRLCPINFSAERYRKEFEGDGIRES